MSLSLPHNRVANPSLGGSQRRPKHLRIHIDFGHVGRPQRVAHEDFHEQRINSKSRAVVAYPCRSA